MQYQKQHEVASSSSNPNNKNDIEYKVQYDIWNFTTKEVIERSFTNAKIPMWQSSPIVSSNIPLYNQDGFLLFDPVSTEASTLTSSNGTSSSKQTAAVAQQYPINAFISPIANYPSSVSSSPETAAMYTKWMRSYVIGNHQVEDDEELMVGDGRTEENPFSFLVYPILIDNDESVTTNGTDDATKSKKIVGYLSAAFFWKDYIEGILDPSSTEENEDEESSVDESLVVVLQNPCEQTVTFQIVRTRK